jgi:hypothetical protein
MVLCFKIKNAWCFVCSVICLNGMELKHRENFVSKTNTSTSMLSCYMSTFNLLLHIPPAILFMQMLITTWLSLPVTSALGWLTYVRWEWGAINQYARTRKHQVPSFPPSISHFSSIVQQWRTTNCALLVLPADYKIYEISIQHLQGCTSQCLW